MLLRFFRSSFFSQYMAIIFAGLLLWSRAFLDSPPMPPAEGPVPCYKLVFFVFSDLPFLAVVIGFLLNLLSAFYINYLLTKHEILTKNSSLAAFLFMFLVSYYPVLLTIHPVSIAIFILLLTLEKIFTSYSHKDPIELAYTSGFLISIGSMFYFPLIFFYLLVLISFIVFRTSSFREWVSSFIGLATPYIFLIVYYFWNDIVPAKVFEYIHSFHLRMQLDLFGNSGFLIFTAIQVLLVLFGMVAGLTRISEKTIEIRRKTILLMWLAIIVILTFPFTGSLLPYHLLVSFIPVSALLSLYLLRLKKSFWQEIILSALIILVLFHNLFPFFT